MTVFLHFCIPALRLLSRVSVSGNYDVSYGISNLQTLNNYIIDLFYKNSFHTNREK